MSVAGKVSGADLAAVPGQPLDRLAMKWAVALTDLEVVEGRYLIFTAGILKGTVQRDF